MCSTQFNCRRIGIIFIVAICAGVTPSTAAINYIGPSVNSQVNIFVEGHVDETVPLFPEFPLPNQSTFPGSHGSVTGSATIDVSGTFASASSITITLNNAGSVDDPGGSADYFTELGLIFEIADACVETTFVGSLDGSTSADISYLDLIFGGTAIGGSLFHEQVNIREGISAGPISIPINVTHKLPPGIYALSFQNRLAVERSQQSSAFASGASVLQLTIQFGPEIPPGDWINPDGGDWSVGDNWSCCQPPGASDTAEFALPGAYTVRLTADSTNAMMQVSGASAAEMAHAKLQLDGFTYQAELIAVQPHGHLEIDGASGLVRANNLHVAAGGKLSGNARLLPATELVETDFTLNGEITMGPADDAAPVRQRFLNADGGLEPAEYFAHLAVRGNYSQGATGTMHVTLTREKAVNEGALAADNLPAPPRSTELFVTGRATLGGTLKVTTAPEIFPLVGNYVPQHGDKFVIVDSGDQVTSPFSDYELPNAFNGLPLKPIVIDELETRTLKLVTPQKVVLAWGHDLPVGLDNHLLLSHQLTRIAVFDSEEAFTSTNVAALAEYQNNLLEHVREQFYRSFIGGIEFVVGDPEPGAINVYFLEKVPEFGNLLGIAYTGIDRFNLDPEGGAAIIVNGFQHDNSNDFELDAETVTHEIGHLLGLRHIDPPGAQSVMDYQSEAGDIETFAVEAFNITEPPKAGGTIFPHTHNPTYHLLRYIDGWSHEELEALDVRPGEWDLPGAIADGVDVRFTLRTGGEGDPNATLYEVLVFASPSDGMMDVLAELDQVTLEQLAGMTFGVNEAEGIGLLAKSTAEGEYDIALAPGNPFESEALVLYPGLGQLEGFLQIASMLPAGFETLADIMLSVNIVPDLPGDYNNDGTVDAADYVVWRKNEGTTNILPNDPLGGTIGAAQYSQWRANFGRTAGAGVAGSSNTTVNATAAVPEPATVILLWMAGIACPLGRVRRLRRGRS